MRYVGKERGLGSVERCQRLNTLTFLRVGKKGSDRGSHQIIDGPSNFPRPVILINGVVGRRPPA